MVRDTIRLGFINESPHAFFPLKESSQIVLGGSLGIGELDIIEPKKRNFIHLVKSSDSKVVSALLKYELKKQSQTLVVWVRMSPENGQAAIKIGIFKKGDEPDAQNLENLSSNTVQLGEAGLRTCLSWKIGENESEDSIMIGSVVEGEEIGAEPPNEDGPAKVYVFIADSDYADAMEIYETDQPEESGSVTEYGLRAGPWHVKGQPVHENITLAALIKSGVITSTTYGSVIGPLNTRKVLQPDVWEFIRGAMWNDDPDCDFFQDSEDSNGNFTNDIKWTMKFSAGEHLNWNLFDNEFVKRSHFGNLQFLHAMATSAGEKASITKGNIMLWLEVMYQVAIKKIPFDTQVGSTKLKEFFKDDTTPKGNTTISNMLQGSKTKYKRVKLERRALGTCFHLIQDSYSLPHCKRVCTNRGNIHIQSQPLSLAGRNVHIYSFDGGRIGRFGAVENFHCYTNQDHDVHSYYDRSPTKTVLDAANPDTFSSIIGANDAIDKCAKLAEYFKREAPWEPEVRKFLDTEVFPLTNGDAIPKDKKIEIM